MPFSLTVDTLIFVLGTAYCYCFVTLSDAITSPFVSAILERGFGVSPRPAAFGGQPNAMLALSNLRTPYRSVSRCFCPLPIIGFVGSHADPNALVCRFVGSVVKLPHRKLSGKLWRISLSFWRDGNSAVTVTLPSRNSTVTLRK